MGEFGFPGRSGGRRRRQAPRAGERTGEGALSGHDAPNLGTTSLENTDELDEPPMVCS